MNNHCRLLFYGNDSFFMDVVKCIADRHEYDLSLMTICTLNHENININGEIIDLTLLYRKETVSKAFEKYTPTVLDGNLLKDFYECKSYFMRTIDRVFIYPKSVRNQEEYFYELLSFTLAFFQQNHFFKAVVFEATPHHPWELIVFFVARYLRIETRMISRTLLDDRVVLSKDFCEEFNEFIRFSPNEKFLGSRLKIDAIKKTFLLHHIKVITKQSRKSMFKLLPLEFISFFPWLFLFYLRSYRNYTNGYMCLGSIEFFLLLIQQKIKNLCLTHWFDKNSDHVDMSVNFVYFALHYQPERTTDPEANEFSHQYLAIVLLSQALPEGWKIYVKEHPRQCATHPDIRQRHYRSVEFFLSIKSIPNVCLIHPTCNADELIDNCKMTASCTGSTVWEGMLKGKPGVTFGRVWHSSCHSNFLVKCVDDAVTAFRILSKKSEADVYKDIDEFLAEFQTCLIVSANTELFASASTMSRKILSSNMAEAIVKSLI